VGGGVLISQGGNMVGGGFEGGGGGVWCVEGGIRGFFFFVLDCFLSLLNRSTGS
jgi:hypothetical protein